MPAPKRLFSALAFACVMCYAVAGVCQCEVLEHELDVQICQLTDVLASRRTPRGPNERRDRAGPLAKVATWSDGFFYRQYRITREQFHDLRASLALIVRARDPHMAYVSAGSLVPLDTKILVTLRILAGGRYLDMVWYGVCVNHVPTYVMEIVEAMNACGYLDNIKMPSTPQEVRIVQAGWDSVSIRKHGHVQMPGTIGAVDGLAVMIRRPSRRDRETMAVDNDAFWNRKGFFALLACGVCDAYAQFMYWGMLWPGATNDIVAYRQTGLLELFQPGLPLAAGHLVLDEAYSCIGGNHHLTPYSKHQLRAAARVSSRPNVPLTLPMNVCAQTLAH